MKRKISILISVLAVLLVLGCVFMACSERGEVTTNPDEGEPEEVITRTVEVICGDVRKEYTVEEGAKISLKATLNADGYFVCWMSNNTVFSYEKDVEYTVSCDAVVKAIYASSQKIELDAAGGTLPDSYDIEINAFNKNLPSADGGLFVGYGYVLPVPTKDRYDFVGWTIGNNTVTDSHGVSNGIFSGSFTKFVASYEEKPSVNIVLATLSGGKEEVYEERKVYIEDFSSVMNAPTLIDMECTGWKRGRDLVSDSDEYIFYLNGSDIVPGETYKFVAQYREAYKITVLSGSGGGSYQRDEEVALAAIYPLGSSFLGWVVTQKDEQGNKESYYLGNIIIAGEVSPCLITAEAVKYYYEKELREAPLPHLTVNVEEMGTDPTEDKIEMEIDGLGTVTVYKAGENETVTLGMMEKLGIVITEGANPRISATFRRKAHTLTYYISCVVNGDRIQGIEDAITDAGYVFEYNEDETALIIRDYYDYNDSIVLIDMPAVNHYKFGNWENMDGTGKIPSAMPDTDITLSAKFTANTHHITVSCNNKEGAVKIGEGTGTMDGFYDYGSVIKFRVTAISGYKFNKWLNLDGEDAMDGAVISSIRTEKEPNVGVDIYYYYEYTVRKDETFTVVFQPRDYKITYILSVIYDEEDVTAQSKYFTEDGYADGWNVTTESRNYGEKVNYKRVAAVGGDAEGDPQLKFGAENWEVSNWVSDTNIFTYSTMPANDITVRAKCTIKTYKIGFNQQNVSYLLLSINGNEETEKYGANGVFTVPHGAEIKLKLYINTGYEFSAISTTDNDAVAINSQEVISRYENDVSFNVYMTKDIGYILKTTERILTLAYYVSVDYEHADEEVALSNYLNINQTQSVTHNGETYYLLESINGQNITKEDMPYDELIVDPVLNATQQKYSFGGWKKMIKIAGVDDDYSGEEYEEYSGAKMPDDDVWAYGSLTLNAYRADIATSTFRFDGNPNTAALTAIPDSIVNNGEQTEISDIDIYTPYGGMYTYFTEFNIEGHNPTGYEFVNWILTAGNNTATLEITVDAETVRNEIIKEEKSGYVFKYKVNDDGSLTVYITSNMTLGAKFEICTYTATVINETEDFTVSLADKDSYSRKISFDYNSQLDLMFTVTGIARQGRRALRFVISSDKDNYRDTVIEEHLISFDLDKLSYGKVGNTEIDTLITTTEETNMEQRNRDLYLWIDSIDIEYKVYYTIFAPSSSKGNLTAQKATIQVDTQGTPFTVKFNETIDLLDNEKTKELVWNTFNQAEIQNSFYSGWYKDPAAGQYEVSSSSSNDGEAMRDASGTSYAASKQYTHTSYSSHAYFSCYLVYAFLANQGEARINETVRTTVEYKSFLGGYFNEINVPQIGTDGTTITALSKDAFKDIDNIVLISLPDTVTQIGESAFQNCTSLTVTGLTDKVYSIGKSAYSGCISIESVYIGLNVKYIGEEAFSGMANLAYINYNTTYSLGTKIEVRNKPFANSGMAVEGGMTFNVGANAVYVPNELFDGELYTVNGNYLKTVTFDEEGEYVHINGNAFASTAIEHFYPNARVNSLGESIFSRCNYLKEVDMTEIAVESIPVKCFQYCLNLEEVILPKTVTKIKNYAFVGCPKLVSVYYSNPDGISEIGVRVFGRGEGQDGYEFKLERVTNVTEKDNPDGPEKVVRLINLTIVDKNAFYYCENIKEVYLGGNEVSLADEIFCGAARIEKLVYNIATGSDKSSYEMVTFANTAGEKIRTKCDLILGEDVRKVPQYMFYNFNVVGTLTIPETITEIAMGAFGKMTDLETIYFNLNGDNDEGSAENKPFIGSGKSTGMTVIFGPKVTSIKSNLFNEMANLTTVNFTEPEGDAYRDLTIRSSAFEGTGITSFTIPERGGEISFEANVFKGTNLATFTVSDNTMVTFTGPTLYYVSSRTSLEITIFGRTMSGLMASLDGTSSIVVTKKPTGGLSGVLSGTMNNSSNCKVFVLEREDDLSLSESASFTVNSKAIIHGDLTEGSGSAQRGDLASFMAVAYDVDDFDKKNAITAVNYMIISEDGSAISFDDDRTVNADKFEARQTVAFTSVIHDGSLFKINATLGDVSVSDQLRVANLNGTVSILPGAVATLAGETYIGGDSGLSVLDGKTTVCDSVHSGYSISVASGIAQLTEPYGQKVSTETYDDLNVEDGAVLYIDSLIEAYHLSAAVGSNIILRENGILRLSKENTGSLNGEITSDAKATGIFATSYLDDGNMVDVVVNADAYYSTLKHAFGDTVFDDGSGGILITLLKDLSGEKAVTEKLSTDTRTITLDCNGYEVVTETNASIDVVGDLTILNADITANDNAITATSDGTFTLTSGTVTAVNNAINVIGNVVLAKGTTVTATNGYALNASREVTVEGTVIGKTYGIYYANDIVGYSVTVSGSVTATDIGIYLNTRGIDFILSNGATITANFGINMRFADTDTTNATFVLENGSTVTGTTAGVTLYGKGYSRINGTVIAAAERQVTEFNAQTVFSGALVAIKNQVDAGMKVEIGGTLTNNDGDALIYVGYDYMKVGAGSSTEETIALTGSGVLNGNKAEIIRTFNSSYNADSPAFICKENNITMFAFADNSASSRYYYNYTPVIIGSSDVYRLDKIDWDAADETVRYVTHITAIPSEIGAGTVIIADNGGEMTGSIEEGGILLTGGELRIAGETSSTIAGQLAVCGDNASIIFDTPTVNITGGVIYVGNETDNSEKITVASGITKLMSAGQAVFACGLQISEGAELEIRGTVQNFGTVKTYGSLHICDGFVAEEGEVSGIAVQQFNVKILGMENSSILIGAKRIYLREIETEGVLTIRADDNDTATTVSFNRLTLSRELNAYLDELIVEKMNILAGSYTLDTKLNVTNMQVAGDGVRITLNKYAQISRVIGEEGDSCITINGNPESYEDNGEIKYRANYIGTDESDEIKTNFIIGNYTVIAPTSGATEDEKIVVKSTIDVRGSEPVEFSSKAVIAKGSLTAGKLIVRNGATAYLRKHVDINLGGGIELLGGTVKTYDEGGKITVKIGTGGWLYYVSGYNTGVDSGFTAVSADVGAEKFTEAVSVGTLLSYCSGHSYVAVAATCGDYGYSMCVSEIHDKLSDGTEINVKHVRKDVIMPTGNHIFTSADEMTDKHVCTVCGLEEYHRLSSLCILYTPNGEIYYDPYGTQMQFYGLRCEVCKDMYTVWCSDDMFITEREFNDIGKKMTIANIGYMVTAKGDSDLPMINRAVSCITMYGKQYFAVPTFIDGDTSILRYFLVEHTDHYYMAGETGKHKCLCGAEISGGHDMTHTVVEGHVYKGQETTPYGALYAICSYTGCNEKTLIYSTLTSTDVSATAFNQQLAAELQGIYDGSLTVDASNGERVLDNVLFTFVYDGVKYYAVKAVLEKDLDNDGTQEVVTDAQYVIAVAMEFKQNAEKKLTLSTITTADKVRATLASINGGFEFVITEDNTLNDLQNMLNEYYAEYYFDGAYRPVNFILSQSDLRVPVTEMADHYYKYNATYYDLIFVWIKSEDGETVGAAYVPVTHICKDIYYSDGGHHCVKCNGVVTEITHTTNDVIADGDGYLMLGCSACGVGTKIMQEGYSTLSNVTTFLSGYTKTDWATNTATGREEYVSLSIEPIEDTGELYDLYKAWVYADSEGNITDIGVDPTAKSYIEVYVKLTGTGYICHETYKVLVHKCMRYKPNTSGTGHVCVDCGRAYGTGDIAHAYSRTTVKEITVEGTQIKTIVEVCPLCDQVGSYFTDKQCYIKAVNETLGTKVVNFDGKDYRVCLYGNITNEMYPTAGGKDTIVIDGTTYYLWQVQFLPESGTEVSEGLNDTYVLVAAHEHGHTRVVLREGEAFGTKDKLMVTICPYCEELGSFYMYKASFVDEIKQTVGGITVVYNNLEYQVNLSCTKTDIPVDGNKTYIVDGGNNYYLWSACLERNGVTTTIMLSVPIAPTYTLGRFSPTTGDIVRTIAIQKSGYTTRYLTGNCCTIQELYDTMLGNLIVSYGGYDYDVSIPNSYETSTLINTLDSVVNNGTTYYVVDAELRKRKSSAPNITGIQLLVESPHDEGEANGQLTIISYTGQITNGSGTEEANIYVLGYVCKHCGLSSGNSILYQKGANLLSSITGVATLRVEIDDITYKVELNKKTGYTNSSSVGYVINSANSKKYYFWAVTLNEVDGSGTLAEIDGQPIYIALSDTAFV